MDTLHSPDAFFLSLDESPGDLATRHVLADWYEEHGDGASAACLRWTIQRGVFPFRYLREGSPLSVNGPSWNDGWFWWVVEDAYWADWGQPRECQLPRDLWALLEHSFRHEPSTFKEYPTRRKAYEALFAAWPTFAPHNRILRKKESRR